MLKRRRLKKTDYRQRLGLLRSGRIRLVVRKRHSNVHIQFVKYETKGDRTLVEEISKSIKKFGWKAHCSSMPAAYLTGLLAGRKALQKGIKDCIADIGLHATTSSVLYAAVKGVIDAGINVPMGFELKEERVKGAHTAEYARLLKKDNEKYRRQFSHYTKTGFDPEGMVQHFEEVKANILKSFPVNLLEKSLIKNEAE